MREGKKTITLVILIAFSNIYSSIYLNFRTLKANNIRCLSATTKIGAHGKPVMFLHPKDCGGVLTELEQA
jgi:hypothetical protein